MSIFFFFPLHFLVSSVLFYVPIYASRQVLVVGYEPSNISLFVFYSISLSLPIYFSFHTKPGSVSTVMGTNTSNTHINCALSYVMRFLQIVANRLLRKHTPSDISLKILN